MKRLPYEVYHYMNGKTYRHEDNCMDFTDEKFFSEENNIKKNLEFQEKISLEENIWKICEGSPYIVKSKYHSIIWDTWRYFYEMIFEGPDGSSMNICIWNHYPASPISYCKTCLNVIRNERRGKVECQPCKDFKLEIEELETIRLKFKDAIYEKYDRPSAKTSRTLGKV